MPQLLPSCYDPLARHDAHGHLVQSPNVNAGLIGKIPILIALAAFSAPKDQLRQALTAAIRPNLWNGHTYATGRGNVSRSVIHFLH